jgi:hypothetical protein
MSLGVLNNLSALYAENNLNNTNDSLSKTLQQLSSGSKINSGADDAAGLSLVNGLAANSSALTQSQTNATEGVGLLQVADGPRRQQPTRSTLQFFRKSTISDRRPLTTRTRSSLVRPGEWESTPAIPRTKAHRSMICTLLR